MKQQYFLLLFLPLLLAFIPDSVRATHQVGSDMTWICNPANPCLYTFTYVFYQDCPVNGGSANPTPPDLTFDCVGGGTAPLQLMAWHTVASSIDITPLCPGQQSDCNGGTVPGVLAHYYNCTYDFCTGSPCSEYEITATNCCRSNLITSLPNPENTASTTVSTMSFDPGNCNSSPYFNSDPLVYLCNGQSTTFSQGATDPDGDQLRYTLIPCLGSSSNPLSYNPGFSPTAPLGPNWNVSQDPNTGDITFTPVGSGALEVGVMCVKIEEIRNGVVIGSVVRDIEVRVLNCVNNMPVLSGVDDGTEFTIDLCVGENTCFDINSLDPDLGQQLSVSVLNNNSGATVTIGPGPYPVTTVCWTPNSGDIGTHTITLQVEDDFCPIPGIQQFTYTINVRHCDPCDTLEHAASWNSSQNQLDLTVNNTSTGKHISFTEYSWGDGSPTDLLPGNHSAPVNHTFPGPGTYKVCVTIITYIGNMYCSDRICEEITIEGDPCDDHEADWWAVCHASPLCTYTFTDASTPGSTTVTWSFNGVTRQGSPVTYTFPSSGLYFITMTSTYSPPNDPTVICTSSKTMSWNIWCGNGPGPNTGGESTLKTSTFAWNQQNATLEVQLSEQLINDHPTVVEVYDIHGKLLQTRSAVSAQEVRFDFSGLASGVYLLRMVNGEQIETRKFARP